ncbi:MAG: TetR/AcrR family transcriptional regulator [Bacteroidetes bacterium]|nr:TetR/AcrR family transcriptional regulator [Bacteroidota bacterium]
MVKKIKQAPAEEKILDAARQVFMAKGMSGARMQDIADAAGINKALLHYYFRSKEKLFERIFIDAFDKLFPKLGSIIESKDTVFKKIELICSEYINQLQLMPYLPVFVISEMNRHPEVFLHQVWGRKKPPLKAFVELINASIKNGEIKPVNPLQVLLNIISLCIFPPMAKPLFQQIAGISKKGFDEMLEERKKIVPQIIIQPLKK